MSTEISTVETTALVSHRAATNAAGRCRDVVVKTAMRRLQTPSGAWRRPGMLSVSRAVSGRQAK
jgi:hypothetical protein